MTKSKLPAIQRLGGTALVAGLLLLGGAQGCSSNHPTPQLTLKSAEHGSVFTQQFAAACVGPDAEGNTDLVLTDQGAEETLAGLSSTIPIRQVLHIRVLWNPKRDLKTEYNSTTNATLHWYVMGNTPDSASDILEYSGTAYAAVEDSGTGVEVSVRNANIRPVAMRGELQDPVGHCKLEGSVLAVRSRARVKEILANVRTTIAAAASLPTTPAVSVKPEAPSSLAR